MYWLDSRLKEPLSLYGLPLLSPSSSTQSTIINKWVMWRPHNRRQFDGSCPSIIHHSFLPFSFRTSALFPAHPFPPSSAPANQPSFSPPEDLKNNETADDSCSQCRRCRHTLTNHDSSVESNVFEIVYTICTRYRIYTASDLLSLCPTMKAVLFSIRGRRRRFADSFDPRMAFCFIENVVYDPTQGRRRLPLSLMCMKLIIVIWTSSGA